VDEARRAHLAQDQDGIRRIPDPRVRPLTRLSHRNVQRRAREPIRKALGLPEKVPFPLTCGTRLASRAHARGVTLQALSMVMGHSSTAVAAQVYAHLYGRGQAEERFPPGDGSGSIAQPLSGSEDRPRGALLVELTTPLTTHRLKARM
jgi:hypothetical protein